MSRLLLLVLVLNLISCASYFKRKDCESLNWFEHGKKVALSGNWLNADSMVTECRKVDAEIQESQLDLGFKNGMQIYCSNTHAYNVGKAGDFYSRDLCEGPQINVLINEHKKGVAAYCHKSYGFTAGTSGKKYQNVCPKDLEPAFLKEYRRGRKKYVETLIATKEGEVRDLDARMRTMKSDLNFQKGRLTGLRGELNSLETQKAFVASNNPAQLGYIENRIGQLNSDISSLNYDISGKESEIKKLENSRNAKLSEITSFKEELPSLDE
ncbi:MAG: hypothetical protein OM95_07610 [Bdellovibrio sp. ArHS]|uniref:DUF2799 domain-containing protein n=1 Tax=Bdellovibrio sp. ArHS TaxID=1569284 RepID=UPI00058242D7|nr:DUF2799 domain-containing protein [Bdellovibrio sp. ArHS]KHD88663.1 MAG: hypothetical protein OM95_07610 [Bdellovibrio sp. ArHS]